VYAFDLSHLIASSEDLTDSGTNFFVVFINALSSLFLTASEEFSFSISASNSLESSFEKQMLIQQERYEQLQKEYFVEMTNAQTLRIAIDEQNKMIQEFNEDSKEFEAEIEKLNSSLAVKNKELKALINTTKKLVPESVKSSEDAIKWLRSNAYTLR
jgi:septal ring factor EnvC (AmiA/AmiB activator)